MCIRIVPVHPWCDCNDPDPLLQEPKTYCPHHVYVQDDTPDKANGETFVGSHSAVFEDVFLGDSTSSTTETDREVIATLRRPQARWKHCEVYEAMWTDSDGNVLENRELSCFNTPQFNTVASKPRKTYYPWDGLCDHCDTYLSRGRGIGLRVVRLHEGAPAKDAIPGTRRYVLPDGSDLDEDVVEAIGQRSRYCHLQMSFVYLADESKAYGEFKVDREKSAIFLLPPFETLPAKAAAELPAQTSTLGVVTRAAFRVAMFVVRGLTRRRT
ncbi:hypothetical protein B0H67DRAFT_644158 [Lasiosphaeris hirsuta]|uniref:Uncharacterized protein n=1 Tax=Lasiosphaeris hirsuta TaxID=260670 RepID=A0AA40AS32_9PEZI|nr:hypothetical protein B0H67DRAFT_644158 [Lasiosphaeris hirsuta]